jgi:hypothetical protein
MGEIVSVVEATTHQNDCKKAVYMRRWLKVPIICHGIPVHCLFCVCFSNLLPIAKGLFTPHFFSFSFLIFEWIVCSILGAHYFFVTQPKSAIEKNSILIKTRRSAATSHPPPSRYPFTQTLPSTSVAVAVVRAVVVVVAVAVVVVVAAAVAVAGGVVAVVLAVAVAVAVAVTVMVAVAVAVAVAVVVVVTVVVVVVVAVAGGSSDHDDRPHSNDGGNVNASR